MHKASVTIAVPRGDAATPARVDRLPNDLPKLKRYLERLAGQGPLRAVYEASGAGYTYHAIPLARLHRAGELTVFLSRRRRGSDAAREAATADRRGRRRARDRGIPLACDATSIAR